MVGYVSQLHALLPVTFRLPDQPDFSIEFVVDTGFTGFLALPLKAVETLQLPYLRDITATVATDEDVELRVHEATIVWSGVERVVQVLATGRRPLLGTALLVGLAFSAQFTEGGLVTISDL